MANARADDPYVSVCVLTYNHAAFIRQALDSILSQEFCHAWELVVSDDCSTDGTRDILLDYLARHPERMRLTLQPTNRGAIRNWLGLLNSARGRYVAYCDGDDYWTDRFKLQKQVDFLDSHPEYVLCFTRGVLDDAERQARSLLPPTEWDSDVTIDELIAVNYQLSATLMYRADDRTRPLPDFFLDFPFGDLVLYVWLIHTTGLRARCLSDVTAFYRVHSNGMHSGLLASTAARVRLRLMHITFLRRLREAVLKGAHEPAVARSLIGHYWRLVGLYVQTGEYRTASRNLTALAVSPGVLRACASELRLLKTRLGNAAKGRTARGGRWIPQGERPRPEETRDAEPR